MELYGTEAGFCAQTASFWQLIGYLFMIVKIIIPIALITVGIITLGKAVISSDDKEAKKGFNKIIQKFLLAISIFFLPSIITALFNIVSGFAELKNDYNICKTCISHPRGIICTKKVLAMEDDH